MATLLEEEAIRLKRGDEIARLQALCAVIARRIEAARHNERGARYSYSEGKAIRRIAGSVAGLVGEKSNNDRWKNISRKLVEPLANDEPPFGTVLVCIGPGGVPDDVHVVSVSRMARESLRKESDVIEEMQKAKNLLLTEENFSEFMDRLAEEILKGQLSLPLRPRPTLQIEVSYQLRLGSQSKG